MADCQLCHSSSLHISKTLGVCLACVRQHPQAALEIADRAHRKSRAAFELPEKPPDDPEGLSCRLCVNQCRIPVNGIGYCGLRKNTGQRLMGVTADTGKLSWYQDPLPTNCVGDWVCPGGSGAGYPTFAHCPGPESGYKNLAVFFQACSFNCLFCQNWHFRRETFAGQPHSVDDLLADVDSRTACICFFGGDPSTQLPFSLKAGQRARAKNKEKILRICWETNGSMNPKLLDQMMDLAVASGGCVKFDLKAWNPDLHIVLTGITNRRTLQNFERAARSIRRRPTPPVLIASTLLVPGYIDENEVAAIACFIAALDRNIPYSLLAFHPQFYMLDLPLTSRRLAQSCLRAAGEAGLTNVRIGNTHLLT